MVINTYFMYGHPPRAFHSYQHHCYRCERRRKNSVTYQLIPYLGVALVAFIAGVLINN